MSSSQYFGLSHAAEDNNTVLQSEGDMGDISRPLRTDYVGDRYFQAAASGEVAASDAEASDSELPLHPPANAYVRQYELETLAVTRTAVKYRQMLENMVHMRQGAALKPSQRLLVRWFKPLADAIDEEQVTLA